ncbi:MAG: leucine-rich repeat domain-containing protein [Bacteroidaceae bacterium]|nr:leucine-rich repeat domain-containing protein [Bacteroidaceae bacterium]
MRAVLVWKAIALTFLFVVHLTANAAVGDVLASGTCGTNVTWTLTENGEKAYIKSNTYNGATLTISGTGTMTFKPNLSNIFISGEVSLNKITTSVIVEEGVTSLYTGVASQFSNLRHVSLPSTLTVIGQQAFEYCDALKSIVIPDNVTTIGTSAFFDCDSLRSVTIGKGLTNIPQNCFKNCVRLMTLRLTRYAPNESSPITDFMYRSDPFPGCVSLVSIVVPEAGMTRYLKEEEENEIYYTVWSDYYFYDVDGKTKIYFRDLLRSDHETLFAAGTTNEWAEWVDKFNHAAPKGAEVYTIDGIEGRTVNLNRLTATVTLPEDEREGADDDGVRALVPAFTPVLIKRPSGTLTENLKMQFVMGGELVPENGWYCSNNASLWGETGIYSTNSSIITPHVTPDIMNEPPYGYSLRIDYIIRVLGNTPAGREDFIKAYFEEGFFYGNADKTAPLSSRYFAIDCFKLEGDQFRSISSSEAEEGIASHHCCLKVDNLGGDLTSPFSLNINERTEVTLADNADNTNAITAAATTGATNNRVTLNGRTLYTDGDWNTLCLPFSVDFDGNVDRFFSFMNNIHNATVMELDTEGTYDGDKQTGFDATDGTLNLYFRQVNAIEAGKPYLVKWGNRQGAVSNPVFYDAAITSTAPTPVTFPGGRFVGTYNPIAYGATNTSILFLGAENMLYFPETGASIGACRAYFEITEPNATVKTFNICFGDGIETGIGSLATASSSRSEGSIYSLDGLRINGKPVQRGIYICNGRKVVIK